jgi:hypothetical protein
MKFGTVHLQFSNKIFSVVVKYLLAINTQEREYREGE